MTDIRHRVGVKSLSNDGVYDAVATGRPLVEPGSGAAKRSVARA